MEKNRHNDPCKKFHVLHQVWKKNRHNDPSRMIVVVLTFLLAHRLAWGLGEVYGGHDGCFGCFGLGQGVDDSGITMSSFAGAGGLPCGLLAGLWISFVHWCPSPLCWAARLGVADVEMNLQLFSRWTQIGS